MAGFMVKFWILQDLLQTGHELAAFVAVLGSLIGAAYYLKILMYMFISEDKGRASEWPLASDGVLGLRFIALMMALITLFGGIRPQFYADWILAGLAIK